MITEGQKNLEMSASRERFSFRKIIPGETQSTPADVDIRSFH